MIFQFPTNWQELQHVVSSGTLHHLPVEYKRSPKLIQIYEKTAMLASKEERLSHIRKEIEDNAVSLITGEQVALVENKYPYDLLLQHLPSVSHKLLWFKGGFSIEQAEHYLRSRNLVCCLYENPVALKSVKEIDHYQVFVLNQNLITLSSFAKSA